MTLAINQLIQRLTPVMITPYRFQADNLDLGLPQIFGGQLMAQSLMVAMQQVEPERHLHSCHTYFLAAGKASQPLIYEANILRKGQSFTQVMVSAYQDDELIFQLTASFQVMEAGFEHQNEQVTLPELTELLSENELWQALAPQLPPAMQKAFSVEQAFDVYTKYYNPPFAGKTLPANQQMLAKINGTVAQDLRLHQCLLAYFSDFHCIPTMLHPHQCGVFQQKAQFATLSHSIYFHQGVDFNQWLLFELHSPITTAARGMTSGQVFDVNGKLIASYQQEGLIRPLR